MGQLSSGLKDLLKNQRKNRRFLLFSQKRCKYDLNSNETFCIHEIIDFTGPYFILTSTLSGEFRDFFYFEQFLKECVQAKKVQNFILDQTFLVLRSIFIKSDWCQKKTSLKSSRKFSEINYQK